MAQPKLFVDQREQFESRLSLRIWHADVGQAQQLQHPVFIAPDAAQLIFCPASLDFARDLVFTHEFARPAPRFEQLRKHIDGRGIVAFDISFACPHALRPGLLQVSHGECVGKHGSRQSAGHPPLGKTRQDCSQAVQKGPARSSAAAAGRASSPSSLVKVKESIACLLEFVDELPSHRAGSRTVR